LAEHGGDRIKRRNFPMPKPPDRQHAKAEKRDSGMADDRNKNKKDHQMAIHYC
jgi:hypothetical protein